MHGLPGHRINHSIHPPYTLLHADQFEAMRFYSAMHSFVETALSRGGRHFEYRTQVRLSYGGGTAWVEAEVLFVTTRVAHWQLQEIVDREMMSR